MPLSKEKLEDLRIKAEETIEDCSLAHAGTAFVAGSLGGQFGTDRIPLTALPIKIINDICKLYGIANNRAKVVHIASAIGRLTVRGTVSDEFWDKIKALVPLPKPKKEGWKTYKRWSENISDIFYLLPTGCQWKLLLRFYVAPSTAHDRFQ